MSSYQSSQSSAAADKHQCEGQSRRGALIDMAGAQRTAHTHTHVSARVRPHVWLSPSWRRVRQRGCCPGGAAQARAADPEIQMELV